MPGCSSIFEIVARHGDGFLQVRGDIDLEFGIHVFAGVAHGSS